VLGRIGCSQAGHLPAPIRKPLMTDIYKVPITSGDLIALSNFLNPEWFEEFLEAMPTIDRAAHEEQLRNLQGWLERSKQLVREQQTIAQEVAA